MSQPSAGCGLEYAVDDPHVPDAETICQRGQLCPECGPRVMFHWEVEGTQCYGPVEMYAHDREQAHYAGIEVSDLLAEVWFEDGGWCLTVHRVEVETTPYDEEQWATCYVRVAGLESSYRVDGRA